MVKSGKLNRVNNDMLIQITIEYDVPGVGVGGAPFCMAGCQIKDVLYVKKLGL